MTVTNLFTWMANKLALNVPDFEKRPLYNNAPLVMIGEITTLIAVYLVLYSEVAPMLLTSWLLGALIVKTPAWIYFLRITKGVDEDPHWYPLYLTTLLTSCLFWPVLPLMMFPLVETPYQMFIALVCAALIIGSIVGYISSWRAFLITTQPLLFSLALVFLLGESTIYQLIGALVVIFDLFVILMLRNIIQTNKELNLALESARRANAVKSEFLANMSHEIRTPMNAIVILGNLLQQTKLSRCQSDYLDMMHTSSQALLARVDAVLDSSIIENGKLELDSEPFRLNKVLQGLEHILGGQADEKGIQFQLKVAESTPEYLQGDSQRLSQILLNLVGNAIKFTERGKVTVTIEPAEQTPENIRLCFKIEDTGPGISPEQHEKLFKPFSQVDSSIRRRHGGYGLGLSISQNLVKRMGGKIRLESRLGTGSIFAFCANFTPCTDCEVADAEVLHQSMPDLFAHILLVEDDVLNSSIATELLEVMGATVHVAANGEAALEAIRLERFDVVFMDLQMPQMDGFETAKAIRREYPELELPIIALTAHAISGEREQCLAAGMNDFLTKPIDLPLLTQALVKWAGHRIHGGVNPSKIEISNKRKKSQSSEIEEKLASLTDALGAQRMAVLLEQAIAYLFTAKEEITDALNRDDWGGAAGLIHKLKGAMSIYGGVEVVQFLERVASQSDVPEERSALINELNLELDEINKQLGQQLEMLRNH